MQGPITRAATFAPSTINEEERTVDLVWSAGAEVRRYDWWSDSEWNEVLSMEQNHVRLGRLNNGGPLLADHNAWSIQYQHGVVERAWIKDGEGWATVRFAKDEDSEKVWQKVKDKILRSVSVGYRVYTWEITRAPQSSELDTYRAIDWEPYEISLVSVPADDAAKIRSAEEPEKVVFNVIEEVRMDKEPNPKSGGTSTELDSAKVAEIERKAAEDAAKAERQRVKDVRDAVRAAKLPDAFAENHIDLGTPIDEVRRLVIEEFGKADPNAGTRQNGAPVPAVGVDERDKKREAYTSGLLVRSNSPAARNVKDVGSIREFVMSPIDLARMCLEDVGVNTRGMSRSELWKTARNISGHTRALSTSDFPLILEDAMRKSLDVAYQEAAPTWMPFSRRQDLPDFRQIHNYKIGDVSPLLQVVEGGEYQYGQSTESKHSWRLYKYGRLLKFTEEMFVNDDLGAFNDFAPKMGRQVRQLQSNIVYSLIISNPTMDDGNPLFHSSHNNLGTASAIDENSIAEARKFFLQRKTMGDGVSDGMIMNLAPRFLIVGPNNIQAALKVVQGIIVPNTTANVNTVTGMGLSIIQEGRITGNQWYMACDPMDVDTVKYGFLQGEPEYSITREESFNIDAETLKVKSTFGATIPDHRGLHKNAGV